MQNGSAGSLDAADDIATKSRAARLAVLSIAVVWLVGVLMWGQPGVTRPDGVGYIAYLPSMWLDHDLLFYNEWERFGLIQEGLILFKSATANGHLGNHWTIGPALAWFPAFLTADAARAAVPVLERFPRDGIVLPYNVAVLA